MDLATLKAVNCEAPSATLNVDDEQPALLTGLLKQKSSPRLVVKVPLCLGFSEWIKKVQNVTIIPRRFAENSLYL